MITVDNDFPGGNIILESVQCDTIAIHQDLRDTEGDWFYWYFRVRGAAGRRLTVRFTQSNVIGVRGPGVSTDGGNSWAWLGAESVDDQSFQYAVPDDAEEVRFSFGMPYTEDNLNAFLQRHAGSPYLDVGVLCTTRQGRSTEFVRLGRLDGEPDYRVLLTCRHHCCEMMASYGLEGIMETVLTDPEIGGWFRDHTEFMVIPFIDKDGVENGDQGKNRRPYDHNRDYNGDTPDGSIYPSVRALRERVPNWSDGRLRLAMDMHCPWIRGEYNEDIFIPGGPNPEMWARVGQFSEILERVQTGPLPFRAENNLPFGQAWNIAKNLKGRRSFKRWAETLPGIVLATSIEIPYANASGQAVTADTARAFGFDLARALRRFLEDMNQCGGKHAH